MKSTLTQKGDLRRSNGTGTVGRGERSAPGLRFMLRLYLSRPRRVFGRRAVVRVCSWVWMVHARVVDGGVTATGVLSRERGNLITISITLY